MNLESRRASYTVDAELVSQSLGDAGLATAEKTMAWWIAIAVFAVCTLAVVGIAWDAVELAAATWYGSATFNHGLLVLPICAYLVWLEKDKLARLTPRPAYWGLAAVAAGLAGWLTGVAGGVILVQQFAVVLMIQGLCLSVFGWQVVRQLWFALLYLLFAVPFGDFLIAPLQDLTAHVTVEGVRLFGIPTYLDGIFIYIPTGSFVVAEACSGIRFLIATVALGTLFAGMTYHSLWRGLLFVAMSFVIPIIANSVRAFSIVMVAHYSDNRLAVGVDHIVFGWVLFALITVGLLAVGMWFRDRPREASRPFVGAAESGSNGWTRSIATGVAALVLTVSTGVYGARITDNRPVEFAASLEIPQVGGGWAPAATHDDTWKPDFPGAHAMLMRTYSRGNQRIHMAIAYYLRQGQGREAVSFKNSIVGPEPWRRASDGATVIGLRDENLSVPTTRILMNDRARIVVHWYWVGGTYTGNQYIAKLLEAKVKLFNQNRAAAVIMLAAPYESVPSDAVQTLNEFLRNLAPLQPALERASK